MPGKVKVSRALWDYMTAHEGECACTFPEALCEELKAQRAKTPVVPEYLSHCGIGWTVCSARPGGVKVRIDISYAYRFIPGLVPEFPVSATLSLPKPVPAPVPEPAPAPRKVSVSRALWELLHNSDGILCGHMPAHLRDELCEQRHKIPAVLEYLSHFPGAGWQKCRPLCTSRGTCGVLDTSYAYRFIPGLVPEFVDISKTVTETYDYIVPEYSLNGGPVISGTIGGTSFSRIPMHRILGNHYLRGFEYTDALGVFDPVLKCDGSRISRIRVAKPL